MWDGGPYSDWRLRDSWGNLQFIYGADTSAFATYTTNGPLTADTWHFVTATFDSEMNVTLYVDGVPAATQTETTGISNSSDHNLYIGRYPGNAYYFQGGMDEIRVSGGANSAAWTKFEYANVTSAGNELSWSNEESTGSIPGSVNSGVTILVLKKWGRFGKFRAWRN